MKSSMKLLALLTMGMLSLRARAQMEGTMYYMNSLPQVVINNPAFIPKYRVTVGLPVLSSVALGYTNNGFSYSDFITKENGTVKADLSKLAGSVTDRNYVSQMAQIDLFRLGFKIKSIYITASVAGKVYNRFLLPKDFTSLLINGNTDYVGKTTSFSPQAESMSYIESAIGASVKLTNKLTIGGRFKYLKGIASVTTQTSNFSVAVADNYQITAAADLNVKTSGVYAATQSGFDIAKSYSNYLKNNGIAIDIGATYNLTTKLAVAASLIDIGQIAWTNNVYQYTLDKAKATYTFDGIDAQKLVKGNTDYLTGIGDTLSNRFKFNEVNSASYSTALPSKIYLGGSYQLRKNLSFGAVFYSETFRSRVSTGWTGSVNKHFGKLASMSVSYTVAERSFNNLGAGLSLNFAPIQFYVVGDNLLNAPISLISSQQLNNYINNTKYFSVRTGINFVFGRDTGLPPTPKGGPKGKSGKMNQDKGKKRKPGQVVRSKR